jgi:hypothetical protein
MTIALSNTLDVVRPPLAPCEKSPTAFEEDEAGLVMMIAQSQTVDNPSKTSLIAAKDSTFAPEEAHVGQQTPAQSAQNRGALAWECPFRWTEAFF